MIIDYANYCVDLFGFVLINFTMSVMIHNYYPIIATGLQNIKSHKETVGIALVIVIRFYVV